MLPIDPAVVSALIAQAGLENVFAAYPEDVLSALEQAIRYNETISKLDIEKHIPGATYLPGAGQ